MRNNIRPLPPLSVLRKLFRYEPDTGLIYKLSGRSKGQSVGFTRLDGYKAISCAGKNVFFHRVAWKLMTGEDAPQEIDHRNKDRSDNRWCNLRAVTPEQNLANRPLPGAHLPGVSKKGGRFHARIIMNGTRHHIGTYATAADAHAAYAAEHVNYHGEFSAFASRPS